jgi:Aspartyl protease
LQSVRELIAAFAVAGVAAALLAGRASAITADAEAQSLLAKHRAYVGWQFGDGTFRTMTITGYATDQNGDRTQNFVLRSSGLVYRDAYSAAGRKDPSEEIGFTGKLFWRSDMNGFTMPLYGGYARYLASLYVLQREGTTELPATLLRHGTEDGRSVGVVRVTLAYGDPIDLSIDDRSGAYLRATIDPEGAYRTTVHILSYREVMPGKKMVSSYRLGDAAPLQTYATFEPNVPIADAEFHPPAASAHWDFGRGEPIPISLTRYRILVDAAVNGVQGRFILDTGAAGIVLDDRFADRANAELLPGTVNATTMHGVIASRVRRVSSIAFRDATLRNVLVYSQDFYEHDAWGLDRRGYDGLMGLDLFAAAIVKVNVYGAEMTILNPATETTDAAGLPIVLDLSEGIPAIPMVLNKDIAVNAFLDTGNPGIVFLGPSLIREHHIKIWGCGTLESLAIGPITYAGQGACEWRFAGNYVLLGYDFLKHFDYVFDFPHGRMFMTPNKN